MRLCVGYWVVRKHVMFALTSQVPIVWLHHFFSVITTYTANSINEIFIIYLLEKFVEWIKKKELMKMLTALLNHSIEYLECYFFKKKKSDEKEWAPNKKKHEARIITRIQKIQKKKWKIAVGEASLANCCAHKFSRRNVYMNTWQ